MALLDILTYPDPRLRTVAKAVTDFDAALSQLAGDMADTMYAAPGIGLAATQINAHKRLVVIDISEEKNDLLVLVNPEILQSEGEVESDEGCLSVPEIYAPVKRAERVTIKAQGLDSKAFEIEADEMLAICIQHEIDHLDGKVFVDYLSRLKRDRIRKKLSKVERS